MQPNYIEVSIRADVDSGELLCMLNDGEALGCWEKDGIIHIYWPEHRWKETALEDLKNALDHLGVDSQTADLRVSNVLDQDWNATWVASLNPIRLGKRFRIRQSWHEADPAFRGLELVIDPKRAFGTGYHTTTQLALEWLENSVRGGEHVLDVGTGTGILAMAAIRLGATRALAIDSDPIAVECARENAETNGFGPELEFRLESFEMLEAVKFDVIVANLDGRTMPRFCECLRRLMNPGANICLCGLQEQDLEEITAVLDHADLRTVEIRQREEWLALTIK
jgi:ribosomal protein L11 methyltransferase